MAQSASFSYDGRRMWTQRGRRKVILGLLLVGEHILNKSNEIIPLDESTLQRSGKVIVDEQALTVAVTYNSPYAVRQHEELSWKHAPGRQAKYLETAVNSSKTETAQIMKDALRPWFSGGS